MSKDVYNVQLCRFALSIFPEHSDNRGVTLHKCCKLRVLGQLDTYMLILLKAHIITVVSLDSSAYIRFIYLYIAIRINFQFAQVL